MYVISPRFNAFYHALLQDIYSQMQERHATVLTFKKFKEAIKYANKDYPRYDDLIKDLVSTRDIRTKDLCDHIEWIIRHFSQYGLTFKFVEEEWERILKEAHA